MNLLLEMLDIYSQCVICDRQHHVEGGALGRQLNICGHIEILTPKYSVPLSTY